MSRGVGFELGQPDGQLRLFPPSLAAFSSTQVLKLETSKVFLITLSPSPTCGDGLLTPPPKGQWNMSFPLSHCHNLPLALPCPSCEILQRPPNSFRPSCTLPHWRKVLILKSNSEKAQPIQRTFRPHVSRALTMSIPCQSVVLFL